MSHTTFEQIKRVSYSMTAVALLLASLVGCGSGGNKSDGLLPTPPPTVGASSGSSSSSSSSSSTSSGATTPTNSFVDPVSSKTFTASIRAEPGVVKFNASRELVVTFTNAQNVGEAPSAPIRATSTCGAKAVISNPVISGNRQTFTYTAKGCVGDDKVTFTAVGTTLSPTVGSYTLTTEGESVASILYISSVPQQIAISGAGGNDEASITFQLKGQGGGPAVNEPVKFSIQGAAGGLVLVTPTGVTDDEGKVIARVRSGSAPNTVTILATHEASNITAPSNGLVVASGLSAAGFFNMGLTIFNPRAFGRINEDSTDVVVAVSDRSGNPVVDDTVVNFISPEAGAVPPSCKTKNNTCTVTWKPDGRNPSDGRAQIFSTVKGTEAFTDNNGNLIFDQGDTFDLATQDLGEPYVDANQNGAYDPGEGFVDSNGNKLRDLGDGLWNGLNCKHPTLCSTSTISVDLGVQTTVFMSTGNAHVCNPGDFGQNLQVAPASAIAITGLYLSDGNEFAKNTTGGCPTGNPLPVSTKVSFSVTGGALQGSTSFEIGKNATLPTGPYGVVYKAVDSLAEGKTEAVEILTMKVEVPGVVVQERAWPIRISTKPATSSSSSSSSSGAGNSFTDPANNKVTTVAIAADPGAVNFNQSRNIKLTFTDADNLPAIPASPIQASSPCVTGGRSTITGPTSANNTSTFVYVAKGCQGDDLISFEAVNGATKVPVGSITLATKGESVGSITYDKTLPSQISIAGSGGVEEAVVTFKLTGQSGAPAVGEVVEFRLEGAAGGVSLVNLSAKTDEAGLAVARVKSGSTPNTVTVVATHTATGLSAPSTGLVVASGLSADGSFKITASKLNINAFNKLGVQSTEILVAVTDLAGNPVLDGSVVNFVSEESGVVEPSCTTKAGFCQVVWKPDSRLVSNGQVQVFATVKGTEKFGDRNGNLVFDDGDTFDLATQDLGEPFSDNNGNGVYDAGEYFQDSDGDKQRDAGDGKWNGLGCKHSTLCSTSQSVVDLGQQVTLYMSDDTSPEVCGLPASLSVAMGSLLEISNIYLSDGNAAVVHASGACTRGNPLPVGSKVTFTATAGSFLGSSSFTVGQREILPSGPYGVIYKPAAAGSEVIFVAVEIPSPGANYESKRYEFRRTVTISNPPAP